jgi:hypothetical protein
VRPGVEENRDEVSRVRRRSLVLSQYLLQVPASNAKRVSHQDIVIYVTVAGAVPSVSQVPVSDKETP